jgi:trimeric autotransporter adhesin
MSNDKAFKVKNGLELAGYDTSKAVTAVDVFVYDTSRDSDGGAWRKRTQGTSWYNETLDTSTRGSRKEFPAVAVIVAEAISHTITVYDGDDPALPMWMVFTDWDYRSTVRMIGTGDGGTYTACLTMLNGCFVVGTEGAASSAVWDGLYVINFVKDHARHYTTNSTYGDFLGVGIVDRNSTGYGVTNSVDFGRIVNTEVNDVAMTVLPNAPIDPATGLPVPTIAVATDGGVSVIKDDGTVVDITITQTKKGIGKIHFTPDNRIIFTAQQSGSDASYWRVCIAPIPTADISATYWQSFTVDELTDYAYADYSIIPALSGGSFPSNDIYALAGVGAVGGNNGLSLLAEDPVTSANGMVAYATSTYNTGWMNGDIKGAWLSDTDETALVGTTPLDDDFSSYADTAAMKAAGWSSISSTGTGDISLVSGAMQLDCDGVDNRARGSRPFTTVVGQEYVVEYSSTSNHHFRVGTTENGTQILSFINQPSGSNTFAYTFVATATTLYVTWEAFNAAGNEPQIDNVSVKLADADRSVNNNGLIVNGTVTRTAVATGADLVAYSGFSASNYLEQPYNSDLDFGTGDFSIMGWVKAADTGGTNTSILMRSGATGLGKIRVRSKLGKFAMWISDDGVSTLDEIIGTSDIDNNNWNFVCSVRQGSFLYAYVNGSLEATASVVNAAGSLSSSDATTRVGISDAGAEPWAGSLALLRISATAPTAEQIAKIYNDEKFLFQENAGAVLHGTSDAVTALAHDSATDLLHVGTSQGRSVFQGLRRVENTTTAVGTAISASNGLVVEE